MRFETVLLVCSVELNKIMLTLKSEFCNLDSESVATLELLTMARFDSSLLHIHQ